VGLRLERSDRDGSTTKDDISALRVAALDAFNARDFPSAAGFLSQLITLEPEEYAWREALAQCYVDGSGLNVFGDAEESSRRAALEYDAALRLLEKRRGVEKENARSASRNDRAETEARSESSFLIAKARVMAGSALAYEVGSNYEEAVRRYEEALAAAANAGVPADPLVVNSKANALASLGDWENARTAYLRSAQGFRDASQRPNLGFSVSGLGFRRARSNAGSSPADARFRADGVAFSSVNAALALAQLGDLKGAESELRNVTRRAPGVVDARAALAALYWNSDRPGDAEREWEFACDTIDVGCAKYRDGHWLRTVRRWPPVMTDLMQKFLKIA
jgi:tetratricopeptide (TPR) repeat protein